MRNQLQRFGGAERPSTGHDAVCRPGQSWSRTCPECPERPAPIIQLCPGRGAAFLGGFWGRRSCACVARLAAPCIGRQRFAGSGFPVRHALIPSGGDLRRARSQRRYRPELPSSFRRALALFFPPSLPYGERHRSYRAHGWLRATSKRYGYDTSYLMMLEHSPPHSSSSSR